MTTGVFVGGVQVLTQAPESSQSLALRDSSGPGGQVRSLCTWPLPHGEALSSPWAEFTCG